MSPLRPTPDWWKSAVVYQIYPRSFADFDGDGVGDLAGITARLDHLDTLGVDVLWLSPFYRSPQDDNGYDISDFEDVDPMFGTLADLDTLLAQAHERGIRVILDLVVNHTSDEHSWFQESRNPDSPKRDWYWWRPARPGHQPGEPGAEPTNWGSFFSGSAWQLDELSGEYYLHLFSRKQPDLNWENPEVRAAVYAMMNRWADRGVDGFRMDVINLISKAVQPDGSLLDGPFAGPGQYASGAAHYFNGPRIHEFLHEMHREVLAGRNLLVVGEMPGASVEDAVRYTDPERGEVSMVFTFEHMDLDTAPGGAKWDLAPLRLVDLKANLSRWQQGLAEIGWNSLYWNNHDQPRIVSRWGDDGEHRTVSAKSLATVLHLLRGTPYVYQGEEIGMTNANLADLSHYRDIESINWATHALAEGRPEAEVLRSLAVKGRDNARTPMQWDATPNAGFTTGHPWLGVNPNHASINAEAAYADPTSVFHHYRALIAMRHELPVVVHGDYRLLLPEHEQVFAYVRSHGGASLLVLANLSPAPAQVSLGAESSLLQGQLLLATHEATAHSGPLQLAPWESRAYLAGPSTSGVASTTSTTSTTSADTTTNTRSEPQP